MSRASFKLGPLEMEALGILGERHPLSVHDLTQALGSTGRDLAYTTVLTVVSRLHGKGLLTRKKEGRQYLYSPAKTAGRTSESLITRMHKSLFKSERLKPILALLRQSDDLSDDELKELHAAVEAKLKQRRDERKDKA